MMRWLRLSAALSLSLSLSTSGSAQSTRPDVSPGQPLAAAADETGEAVPLDALVREFVEHNPALRAAQSRYEAALKRPSQVGTLPEPRLSITDFGVGHPFSGLNRSNFAYRALGVSQLMPFPGKLALAEEEARKEAESERQAYRQQLLESAAKLKVAYYDWYAAWKAIEITRKNRELLERFEAIARTRYAVGKGLLQDVLKAQVELSGLAQQLDLLAQRKLSLEAEINYLLGRPLNTPLGRPAEPQRTPLTLDWNALQAAIEENSPRLRAQALQVDTRAVGIERSRKEVWPDLNLSFQWQHTGSLYPDYYMAAAEVNLPIFYRRKQRYAVEEAAARLAEARQNYRATQQETQFQAKDQFLIAKTSEQVLNRYSAGILPQASLALESTVAAYEVGNVNFLTLLDSFTTLLTYERQYSDELARHEQAIARLEPLVGRELTATQGRP